MTATAETHAPGGRYGLAQAARMEWIKLRSLRSTWWTLAVTAAGTIGIGIAVGLNTRNASGDLTNNALAGFQPDIRHTTDDYVVVQNLVAAGLAVALLPALALTAAPNHQVTTAPIDTNPVRQISLAHRKEVTTVPAVTAAVHALTTSRDGYQLTNQAGPA